MGVPSSKPGATPLIQAEAIILRMSEVAAMAKYLNDPRVAKIYVDTSNRILQIV